MLIFAAGVVTGGLLVRTRVVEIAPAPQSNAPATAATSPVGALAPGRQAFVQRVRSELDLTPEQSKQVDRIMRESHKRMIKVYEPVAPEAREETRRVRQEIMALLTPEQKKKFNESVKRRQRDREMTEQRGAPPAQSNTFASPVN